MYQPTQTQARQRPVGILILALLLAAQAIVGIASIIQTVVSVYSSGYDLGVIFNNDTLRTGFWTIVIAAVVSLVLALGFWFVPRRMFWVIFAIEIVYLLFGVIVLTSNQLNWYTIPVFTVLPLVILVYMFADRNVRLAVRRR